MPLWISPERSNIWQGQGAREAGPQQCSLWASPSPQSHSIQPTGLPVWAEGVACHRIQGPSGHGNQWKEREWRLTLLQSLSSPFTHCPDSLSSDYHHVSHTGARTTAHGREHTAVAAPAQGTWRWQIQLLHAACRGSSPGSGMQHVVGTGAAARCSDLEPKLPPVLHAPCQSQSCHCCHMFQDLLPQFPSAPGWM